MVNCSRRGKNKGTNAVMGTHFFCLFVSHFYYFLSSGQTVVPPGSCLSRIGFSNLTDRRVFIEFNFAISRPRALREVSFCAQENVPTNLYGYYALGGARTRETDPSMYQARR